MNVKVLRWLVVFLISCVVLTSSRVASAQVPGVLNYQGRVFVNGTNFDGTANFKFSFVNGGGATLWSNGTSTVSVPVTKGLYTVLLGDTALANMAVIPATVFSNTDVRLRVWFDGGSGLQQLSPDQRIAAVGYALMAAGVQSEGDIVGRRLNIGAAHGLSGDYATIAGGRFNVATGYGSVVGGGAGNVAASDYSVTVGGSSNVVEATCILGTIFGGWGNSIRDNVDHGMIGNGDNNTITNHGNYSIIGCGDNNLINHASHSMIGSGAGNAIQFGSTLSVIGSGFMNSITNSARSVLGGGSQNSIQGGSSYSVLGGGMGNVLQSNSYHGVLCGGFSNSIGDYAEDSVVGGGNQNSIGTQAPASTLGGGGQNSIHEYSYTSTLGGGYTNQIGKYANASTLGGGYGNGIQDFASYSTLGGGYGNKAGGLYSTVPGGQENSATGTCSFAAGRRAKALHAGTFVWGDVTDEDISSTASNQFIIRAAGGVGVGTNKPGAAVDVLGKVESHGLRVMGANSIAGGPENGIVRVVNQYTAGASAPALRVLGQGGNSDYGALCVSQNGTGNIAKFGNASSWVAWLTTNGTWNALAFNPTSDRNAKQDFTTVDSRAVLDHVMRMPIQTWAYKADGGTRHIGPMAQDFQAAFHVGTDDRHIATVDADGVALAAIQGLYGVVNEKEARIKALERDLQALKDQMQRLQEAALGRER